MKPRVFFFHYNKPASMQQKRNVLTVHWKGACHLVHHVQCFAPIRTVNRATQPRCVMKGSAQSIDFYTDAGGEVSAIINLAR